MLEGMSFICLPHFSQVIVPLALIASEILSPQEIIRPFKALETLSALFLPFSLRAANWAGVVKLLAAIVLGCKFILSAIPCRDWAKEMSFSLSYNETGKILR